MQEVEKFLEENRMGSLATIENGRPRVRPWGFMMVEDGKYYFCTANNKNVYSQLKETPVIEFTSTSKDMVTVRLSGEVIFTNDLSLKEKVLENSPQVKSIYQSADNPIFEIFYVEHGEVIISDFSGQPSRITKF